MSNAHSVELAVDFVRRLNAGEIPGTNGIQVDIHDAVVDGCVVVLFGSTLSGDPTAPRAAGSPVACRIELLDGAVSDWCLYHAGG